MIRYLLLLFALGGGPAMAQQSPQKPLAEGGYAYQLFVPTGYDADGAHRWPVVVFLHGSGERGGDIARVKVNGIPKVVDRPGAHPFIAISPLLPGRSTAYTAQVYDPDYIVAVDAASGRQTDPAPSPRGVYRITLARSFDITHAKTQDGNRSLLHAVAADGRLRGFVHAYLGMQDRNMPIHIEDLVPRREVESIGTSFKALTGDQLRALTTRGEQLIRVLTAHYVPQLAAPRIEPDRP